MSAMVLRFDLSVRDQLLSSSLGDHHAGDHAGDPGGGQVTVFAAQTKPCATNRHLFWDEQLSLLVPACAMTEHGSCASSVKISMVGSGAGAPAGSGAGPGAGTVFAVAQKPLYNFIQHVVEPKDGFLQPKQDRYDAVVSLAICDALGAARSGSPAPAPVPVSARSGSGSTTPALRVRLGIMLFRKKLGAEQSEDIVERFEKSKSTCKLFILLFLNL
jgi:hypothetical protein